MLRFDGHLQHAVWAIWAAPASKMMATHAVLPCLVAARLVQSVTMSAFSHSKDPTNDYLLITAKTGWDALRLVTGMEEEIFLQRLKE